MHNLCWNTLLLYNQNFQRDYNTQKSARTATSNALDKLCIVSKQLKKIACSIPHFVKKLELGITGEFSDQEVERELVEKFILEKNKPKKTGFRSKTVKFKSNYAHNHVIFRLFTDNRLFPNARTTGEPHPKPGPSPRPAFPTKLRQHLDKHSPSHVRHELRKLSNKS